MRANRDDDDNAGHRTLQPNLRPLHILKAVVETAAPVTIAEIGAALDLPKPTIHRLFQTLEDEGWLMRDLSGRGFVAGHLLRRMAANTISGPGLRRERIAILRRLSDAVRETCNISIPDGDAMIYVDRVEAQWPLNIRLPIGTRVPLHCTSAGKTYLSSLQQLQLNRVIARLNLDARTPATITDPKALRAEIDRIRAHGFAEDNEEMMEGMVAIAVPVSDNLYRFFCKPPRTWATLSDALHRVQTAHSTPQPRGRQHFRWLPRSGSLAEMRSPKALGHRIFALILLRMWYPVQHSWNAPP